MTASRTPFFTLLLGLVCVITCADDTTTTTPTGPKALFSPEVTSLAIEVDYTGSRAAPNTALTRRGVEPWSLTEDNVRALFGEGIMLEVPRTLDAMQDIGEQPEGGDGQYDSTELLAISARTRDIIPTSTNQSLHIIFVDGFYEDEAGERKENVLGVSIGETGVIGMFKPVIAGGVTENFVEQATLIHEIGHASGLVDNGLEMVEEHLDEEHGAHCDNSNCVMYYQNEGLADVRAFIMRYIDQSTTVMFDPACIADAQAARTR